jgi:hypothetical protein
MAVDLIAVCGRYSGAFLSAMLLGEEPEVCESSYIFSWGVHTIKGTTFFHLRLRSPDMIIFSP